MTSQSENPDSPQPLLAQAQAYLLRQTRGWTPGYVRLVRARPDVQCAEAAIDAMVLMGETDALKAACRRWWGAVLA